MPMRINISGEEHVVDDEVGMYLAGLIHSLKVLASIPIEEFGLDRKKDDYPVMGWNDFTLRVGHIKRARELIAKNEEIKCPS